ncbi:hypothetical protein DFJ74DRAFT_662851 [Hyaloraphidium curvatum]|nr:hypothetical protein DFJ74DRAFT_662851 [Hyaloraphidium curvatum]
MATAFASFRALFHALLDACGGAGLAPVLYPSLVVPAHSGVGDLAASAFPGDLRELAELRAVVSAVKESSDAVAAALRAASGGVADGLRDAGASVARRIDAMGATTGSLLVLAAGTWASYAYIDYLRHMNPPRRRRRSSVRPSSPVPAPPSPAPQETAPRVRKARDLPPDLADVLHAWGHPAPRVRREH